MILILGYLRGLSSFNKSIFHNEISCKVTLDNIIITLNLLLLYLRDLSLSFDMALYYIGSNWCPGNEDVRVQKKLGNSFIVSFSFVEII